jgi:AbrB family looped-hinge helix DNA binding protein
LASSKEDSLRSEHVATVTSKGQLTVPVAVRRKLGIDPGDQFTFVIDDEDSARFRRVKQTVRSARGMIPTPPGLESVDFDDLIEEAMSDHADEVMRRMRDGAE